MAIRVNENLDIYEGTNFPEELKGKKAYILRGAFDTSAVVMFAQAGFLRADTVEEADVVVFMGGTDVDPALYKEKAHRYTQWPDQKRDIFEKGIYEEAVRQGKVCVGICRGQQMLHVLNGGKLWQHVEGHAGRDHLIYDIDNDCLVLVNSMHHQMIRSEGANGLEVIAVTAKPITMTFENESTKIAFDKDDDHNEIEIEAGAYNDTKCFFVQGHPEVGNIRYQSWFFNKLKDKMVEWGVI